MGKIITAGILWIIIVAAFWGSIFYIDWQFVSKYW